MKKVILLLIFLVACNTIVEENATNETKVEKSKVELVVSEISDYYMSKCESERDDLVRCADRCNDQGLSHLKSYCDEDNNIVHCQCYDSLKLKPEVNTTTTLIDVESYFGEERYEKLPIPYQVDNACGSYQSNQVKRAFQAISEATDGVVTFTDKGEANIFVTCTYLFDCYKLQIEADEMDYEKTEEICEHERGSAEIVKKEGKVIKRAEVTLVGLGGFVETTGRGPSGFYKMSCGHTTNEKHQILKVLGIEEDVFEEKSIMFHEVDQVEEITIDPGVCLGKNIPIGKDIADKLKLIYESG